MLIAQRRWHGRAEFVEELGGRCDLGGPFVLLDRQVFAQPVARSHRMSFNERRALETLPTRIAALWTQIAGLNAILADPDLYARDPGWFGVTTQVLAVARDELAAAEE